MPRVRRECECGTVHDIRLPDVVACAVLEQPVASGYRPDVLLLDSSGEPVGAVEIFHKHRVSDEKARKLGVRYVEVEAAAVIEDPRLWKPIATSQPWTCPECRAYLASPAGVLAARIRRLAELHGIRYPFPPYHVGIARCASCARETLYFRWPGWPRDEPPDMPRPGPVRYRGPAHWVNECHHYRAELPYPPGEFLDPSESEIVDLKATV